VGEGEGAFFLAHPLKALADLVYAQRPAPGEAGPIVGGLRIEEEALAALSAKDFEEVQRAYNPGGVSLFLAELRRDLNL
jgi:hypothetical protein